MKFYRISLFAVLLLAGNACSGSDNNDDPVECTPGCSADATCSDVGGEGVCECNAGFTGDGLTCEVNEACAGITQCATEGTTCSGDELVTCAADNNGCLIEATSDCAATDEVCNDSGDTAVCSAECTDDPACDGILVDAGFCDGNTPVTCVEASTGCLEAVNGTSCGTDICDDSAAPICVANGTADSCASVFAIQGDITFTGTDFTADYTDLQDFAGDACVGTDFANTSAEAVFSANLVAGQTVSIREFGGIDIVLGIMPACDDAGTCYASVDGTTSPAEEAGISYTAIVDETVFLYATPFFSSTTTVDYDLRVAFSTCGDLVVEDVETCDDNAIDGDGCTACTVDQGFNCDNSASPSVCSPAPDLGSFAAADVIPDTVDANAYAAGNSFYYSITFTEDVLLSGTLTATGTGDVDLGFRDSAFDLVFFSAADGDETWTDELVLAGTYLIQVNAFTAVDTGWTLTLSTSAAPICGDLLVEGAEECDDNGVDGDGCTACTVDLGSTCDNTTNPSVCTLPPDIGTFAAADVIPDTIDTDAHAAGSANDTYYSITFTEDVLLSGTLNATGSGDVDLSFRDPQDGLVFSSGSNGDETFTDRLVAAGTYFIRIRAFSAVNAGWTLTLSTIAGPICGDLIVGVGEQCDDNAVDGDGCTACTVDQGFNCDNSASPSICSAAPDLGTFAAAAAIPNKSDTDAHSAGSDTYYSITFTEDVLVSGTLTATGTGDVDLSFLDDQFNEVFSSGAFGDETWTDEPVAAGTYFIGVRAFSAADTGWTLTLSTTTP